MARVGTINSCAPQLREMNAETAEGIIATVPTEWEISAAVRNAWSDLIFRRAGVVTDNVSNWTDKAAPWYGATEEWNG